LDNYNQSTIIYFEIFMDKEYSITDSSNPKFNIKLTYKLDLSDVSMYQHLISDEDKLFGYFAGKLAEAYHVDDCESAVEVYPSKEKEENLLKYEVKCQDGEDDEYSRTIVYSFKIDGNNVSFTQKNKY
jgi:hypothetical protein